MGLIRRLIGSALFHLGDAVETWNDHDLRFTNAGFRLYQWLMSASCRIAPEIWTKA